jgi:amino acid transporter
LIQLIATRSLLSLAFVGPLAGPIHPRQIMAITLWIAGFLCLLNIALAFSFRKRHKKEVISYYAVCVIEMAIFAFALLFYFGAITRSQIPYPLPPNLPINRAEIAAALAIGIGLFPAAYWHSINLSELPSRIAEDGKTLRNRAGGIHINKAPGEWMN